MKGQKRQGNPPSKKPTTEPKLAYIGKPLTQGEIDQKKREGKNASGYTPLEGIIPASHWQELEGKANKPSSGNGHGTHYNNCTKNAPVFIDALVEQFSLLLGDDPENTPQNINRAAKLYRQVEMSEEDFRAVLHEALDQAQHYHSSKIKKQRADRRPNRMPVFFTILEERIGQKL